MTNPIVPTVTTARTVTTVGTVPSVTTVTIVPNVTTVRPVTTVRKSSATFSHPDKLLLVVSFSLAAILF